jgi:hypothetical protein
MIVLSLPFCENFAVILILGVFWILSKMPEVATQRCHRKSCGRLCHPSLFAFQRAFTQSLRDLPSKAKSKVKNLYSYNISLFN